VGDCAAVVCEFCVGVGWVEGEGAPDGEVSACDVVVGCLVVGLVEGGGDVGRCVEGDDAFDG